MLGEYKQGEVEQDSATACRAACSYYLERLHRARCHVAGGFQRLQVHDDQHAIWHRMLFGLPQSGQIMERDARTSWGDEGTLQHHVNRLQG